MQWVTAGLELVRHSGKLFATQWDEHSEEPIVSMMQLIRTTLAETQIIDVFALQDHDQPAQSGAIVEDRAGRPLASIILSQ